MGKSRMMGAGLGSSTLYKSNPSVNTFGGNKKQGLPVSVGLDSWADRASRSFSVGTNRDKLVVMNQLGGVGVGRSMFNVNYAHKDGAKKLNEVIVFKNVANYDILNSIPTNYFLYGVQHVDEDNVIFHLQNPSTCLTPYKKHLQFFGTPNLFPLVAVLDNQNLIITYDTFGQILALNGVPQLAIDFIINSLKPPANKIFVAYQGSVVC